MNLSSINSNLSRLRPLISPHSKKRRLSFSTHSSKTSPIRSKNFDLISMFIRLCIHPDEDYALRRMKMFFSSHSANVCDEFGCNLLMYALRYQHDQLFDFLLNEMSLDLSLRSKDQQGNTILHYVVIYGKDKRRIMENLIVKFNKCGIDIDERNNFGFTPLLFGKKDKIFIRY